MPGRIVCRRGSTICVLIAVSSGWRANPRAGFSLGYDMKIWMGSATSKKTRQSCGDGVAYLHVIAHRFHRLVQFLMN